MAELTLCPDGKLLQNLLSVSQTFGDVLIAPNQLIRQVVSKAVLALINVGDMALVVCQENFGMIVKHNLYCLIAQAEENCVFRTDPLFEINHVSIPVATFRKLEMFFVVIRFVLLLKQVVAKVIQ